MAFLKNGSRCHDSYLLRRLWGRSGSRSSELCARPPSKVLESFIRDDVPLEGLFGAVGCPIIKFDLPKTKGYVLGGLISFLRYCDVDRGHHQVGHLEEKELVAAFAALASFARG